MASPAAKPREAPFHQRDSVAVGARLGLTGFFGGLFIASIQNSLRRENVGVSGVWRYSRGRIASLTVGAAAYGFVDSAAGNLRERNDHWNKALAGFLGTGLCMLSTGKVSTVIGAGAFVGTFLGVMEYCGGQLHSYRNRTEEDEFERKMALRANRRRPIEETIAEIGEGRGIRPPGYDERRKERIKEKYGFEIKTIPATADGKPI